MTLLLEVDPQLYWSLDEREQTRLADELLAMGVMLSDCARLYTDEKGKVVGAVRYLRDSEGKHYAVDGEVAVEHVGLVP